MSDVRDLSNERLSLARITRQKDARAFTRRAVVAALLTAVLLVFASLTLVRSSQRARLRKQNPVAAYLLPSGEDGAVRLNGGRRETVRLPMSVRSGTQLELMPGSKVTVVRAATGEISVLAGPQHMTFEAKPPVELNYLVSPTDETLTAARVAVGKPHSAVVVTSPVNMTRYLNPLIAWTTREGALYDVGVIDSADPYVPPRTASGIRPPLALADLQTPQRKQLGADRNYEIVVREAGASWVAASARCLTTADAKLEATLPTEPLALMQEALSAMANKPFRTGDAWLALSRLPMEWRKTELGVRLRFAVAAELGLKEDLLLALEDSAALTPP